MYSYIRIHISFLQFASFICELSQWWRAKQCTQGSSQRFCPVSPQQTNAPRADRQTGSSLRRAAGRPVLYFGVPFFGYKTGIKRRFSFFRRSHARHLFLLPGFTICFLFFSVFFLVRSSFLLEVRSRPRSQWPKGTYVVSYEVIHYQVRLYTTTIHTMLRNDDVLKYAHILSLIHI